MTETLTTKQGEADYAALAHAVEKFLGPRMAWFTDSRAVDDDLVELAAALDDLVKRMREAARGVSRASWMMADAKSSRNQAAGDADAKYLGMEPEQTYEWKAADEIERLRREEERLTDALERIALLDECDGHELTAEHALRAIAIATSTLGKHPSEIHAARYARAAMQSSKPKEN